MTAQVVWFKKDLRLHDHVALTKALRQGSVLPLYIVEPAMWQQQDASARHYAFLRDCVRSLHQDILKTAVSHTHGLVVRVGDAVDVLADLHRTLGPFDLWSHQETGNGWSYARDRRVAAWCAQHAVTWQQPRQHGVIRKRKDRNGWAARWYAYMTQPQCPKPHAARWLHAPSDPFPSPDAIGLSVDFVSVQPGGREQGLQALHSFLTNRGQFYTKNMSYPVVAFRDCSRISPHLTWGTLSVREAFQIASLRHQAVLKLARSDQGSWPSAMRSFLG